MEQAVSLLTQRLDSLHSDIGEIKTVLSGLTSAITKLALVEERQAVTNASVERAFTAIANCEKELKETNTRLMIIERSMPQQRQTTEWVYELLKWCAILILAAVAKKMGLL